MMITIRCKIQKGKYNNVINTEATELDISTISQTGVSMDKTTKDDKDYTNIVKI